ncbi:MAG TPA: M56 family metallopeptidase [Streptosporangiaceae bacterium]|nr:M56 family metallopeptidase [Streptosporangiaceae bacterium]
MTGLDDAALLAVVAIASALGASALPRATWPRRSPAVAILLWQALGLASGLATVGTLIGLALPASDGGLVRSVLHAGALLRDGDVFGMAAMFGLSSARTAQVPGAVSAAGAAPASVPAAGSGGSWPAMILAVRLTCLAAGLALLTLLCWVLLAALAAALQARRRQRELLTLLAHGDPKVPGALVVDHPGAAAYCLPGLRSRIVVSVGTLELLGRRELAAVLAHERAHLRERHDLVLLPFTALRRAFPRSATCTDAHRSVALLVEMLADDRALRGRPARELVSALVRFGTAGTCPAPAGALAAGEGEVAARVTRLLKPVRPLPAVAVLAICLSAALLVAAPVTLLLV